MKKSDLAQAPSAEHYKGFKIEPLQYILENDLSYLVGNIIRYLSRASLEDSKLKGGYLVDLKKAKFHLDLMIDLLEKKEREKNNCASPCE